MANLSEPFVQGPLISVIVPLYNVERYLARCLDSLLAQTYANLQILLIDDGSTDSSPAICDQYAAKDARFEVLHKPNGGISHARNTGLELARGEYISFVDSDDYVHPHFIERLYNAMKHNPCGFVMCNFECVDEDGNKIDWQPGLGHPELNGRVSPKTAMRVFDSHTIGVYVVPWNKLYRRDMFAHIRYPLNRIHEDQYVIHYLLDLCEYVYCVPDVVYYYVRRRSSITGAVYETRHMDVIEAFLDRAHTYCARGEYQLMQSAYRRSCNELAYARFRLDYKSRENRHTWRRFRRMLLAERKAVFRHGGWNIILRYLAALYAPIPYYCAMNQLWRNPGLRQELREEKQARKEMQGRL